MNREIKIDSGRDCEAGPFRANTEKFSIVEVLVLEYCVNVIQ